MEDISVVELKKRMNQGETLHILDVREPYEYDEYNIGAKLIPLGELSSRLEEIEDWKNEEVVVHCRTGGRSAAARQFLINQGFTNVRNLTGGMMAHAQSEGITIS